MTLDDSGAEGKNRPQLAEARETESVYQAAGDSRLLAETVVEDVTEGDRVLDVGTGSGCVGHRIRTETDATVVGSDINPEACEQAADVGLQAVRADLFEPFTPATFDVVCCNPPYLPTPPEREWDDWMEKALSGGPDGRAMVDPFLEDVGHVLADGGEAFLLISTLTDPEAVREKATACGLSMETIAKESHPFEKLLVVRLVLE